MLISDLLKIKNTSPYNDLAFLMTTSKIEIASLFQSENDIIILYATLNYQSKMHDNNYFMEIYKMHNQIAYQNSE